MSAGFFAPTHRNLRLLVLCQVLYGCSGAIGLTLTGLVGALMSPSKALATLPFALVTVGTACSTIPVSMLMARLGRRPVFLLGALAGAVGGALAAWAIVRSDFVLFCAANLALGVFQASAQYFRYAATEAAAPGMKARAIAWVVSGGLVAAVLGPTLAAWARNAVPVHTFAGSYLMVLALALVLATVLAFLRLPPAQQRSTVGTRTPLLHLLRRPAFVVAACNGALGYAVMAFVMTAAPLAVVGCGLPVSTAATVIQWHLVAMFAPSFFTGRLIARWGVAPMLLLGSVTFGLAAAVGLSGSTPWHFGLDLALTGLAWNLAFVGGTTVLTEGFAQASAADQARAQAANEFITFAAVALGCLLAGAVFSQRGWLAVNVVIAPAVLLAAAATVWFGWHQRSAARLSSATVNS